MRKVDYTDFHVGLFYNRVQVFRQPICVVSISASAAPSCSLLFPAPRLLAHIISVLFFSISAQSRVFDRQEVVLDFLVTVVYQQYAATVESEAFESSDDSR